MNGNENNTSSNEVAMYTNTINNKFVSPIILTWLSGRYTTTGNRIQARDQDDQELLNLISLKHRWIIDPITDDGERFYRVTWTGVKVLVEYLEQKGRN